MDGWVCGCVGSDARKKDTENKGRCVGEDVGVGVGGCRARVSVSTHVITLPRMDGKGYTSTLRGRATAARKGGSRGRWRGKLEGEGFVLTLIMALMV